MADKSTLIALAAKPILGALFLFLLYGFIWLVWKHFPEGKIKRFLFKSWGKDNGPWAKYKQQPTDRKPDAAKLPSPRE